MSLLAIFYTYKSNLQNDLLYAAKPQIKTVEKKGFLFKKQVEVKVDQFHDWIKENTKELEPFPFSGTAFNDYDLLLEAKGYKVFEEGLKEPSYKMCKLRGSSIYIYDIKSAKTILEKLGQIELSKEDIVNYCINNFPEEAEEGIKAIQKAHEFMKTWLMKVNDNEHGLLIIS